MANIQIPQEFLVDGELCCLMRTTIKSAYYCAHTGEIIKFDKKTFLIKTYMYTRKWRNT